MFKTRQSIYMIIKHNTAQNNRHQQQQRALQNTHNKITTHKHIITQNKNRETTTQTTQTYTQHTQTQNIFLHTTIYIYIGR